MNAITVVERAQPLTGLRAPFPPNQISKLPKETKAQIDARKSDKNLMVWKCPECGNAHHKNAVHLDYVGHAALTDRLLDTDPAWSWEPAALTADGLPAFDRNGGLWIKLTVNGVTRLGYGAADGKAGGDAVKEIIGDALRNAAMRFGAALDLWHKGDLHAEEDFMVERPQRDERVQDVQTIEHQPEQAQTNRKPPLQGPIKTRAALRIACGAFVSELHGCADSFMLAEFLATPDAIALVEQVEAESEFMWKGDGADFLGLEKEISQRASMLEMAEAAGAL